MVQPNQFTQPQDMAGELLSFLNLRETEPTKKMAQGILLNMENNPVYVLPKLQKLREDIRPHQGHISTSNKQNYIKIFQPGSVSIQQLKDFHSLVRKWEDRYRVVLHYNPLNNTFYVA